MKLQHLIRICSLTLFLSIPLVVSQISDSETTTSDAQVTSSVESSTKTFNSTCAKHDNDCKACAAYSECYYCDTDSKCHSKTTKLINDDVCSFKKIYYLTCRVNFLYMVIGSVLLGLIIFVILSVICCCCCCRKKGLKFSKDDLKWARKKEERQQIALEKRQARSERTEEIRKKYGLGKGSNPYQRFDA